MRSIVQPIMVLALLAGTVMVPTAAKAEGHRIAVVDVAKIFKDHPGIKAQVKAVEDKLTAFNNEIKARRENLKAEAEKLKSFTVGTAPYAAQEEKLAGMESKLRLDMARKRKELADAEAKIYYDNYQLIAQAVSAIAKQNQISMVIRFNSENMDMEKGDSVVRGVMKNVVYHDPALDMTGAVMQMLDRHLASASKNAAARR